MTLNQTTLPSGLKIVTDRMESAATVTIGVQARVGGRDEAAHENGLSHVIEHMAFKGTARRTALEVAAEIEGAGGDLNAATASEHTFYQARVLPEDAPLALDILADILTNSLFDPEELAREKDVILQEICAVQDTPDDLVFELFDEAAFPDQPLGRPILGRPETVQTFSAQNIRGFLNVFYGADTLTIAAAGALEHEAIVESAARLFDKLPAVAPPAPAPAVYAGGERVIKRDVEQANVVVGFESVGHRHDMSYAAHIFAQAVGGGMASRLFQEVREKRGLAYSIYSFNWSFSDTGLFGFHAAAAPGRINELIRVALDGLARAREDLSELEAARAKAQMKVSLLAALESSSARAEQIARQTEIFGRVLSSSEIVAAIDGASLEQVRAAGAAILSGPPSLAAVIPSGRVMRAAEIARRLAGG